MRNPLPRFTPEAIAAAVSQMPPGMAAAPDPRHDWSRVRQLTGSDVELFAQGLPGRNFRLVGVEDAELIVVDPESPYRATLRIARADSAEIRHFTGRRGSRMWAVLGVAAGVVVGSSIATGLMYKDCGGDCTDEGMLIGASLIGIPIGLGVLGYYLPGGNRTLSTVYLKP